MKLLHTTLLLSALLAAALIATFAWAGDQPEFVPRDPVVHEGDCTIGNTNDPVDFVPGIFFGNESYAYFVRPGEICDCNVPDFELLSVSQYLFFGPQEVPTSFTVEASLLAAVPDGACNFVPGEAFFTGRSVTYTVDLPCTILVTAPTDGIADFPLDGAYFLSLRYAGGGPGHIVIDDEPQPCIEFRDAGNGWYDMFDLKAGDKSGGGKAIIFGDIVCKIAGVPNEVTPWGSIKTLFK